MNLTPNPMKAINIMENTIENKQKFFAQYYTQQVFKQGDEEEGYSEILTPNWVNIWGILELKSLSSITDEDAIEVARLWDYEFPQPERPKRGRMVLRTFEGIEFRIPQIISDYLRSRGYALPWMGLSVEKQIEYGWIKLTD